MRVTMLLSVLLAPLGALAAPRPLDLSALVERQQRPVKPKPCVALVPAPSVNETKARFDKFAQAFIYKKNITEAFEYITQNYIVSRHLISKNMIRTSVHILMAVVGRTITRRLKMASILRGISLARYGETRT